MASRLFFTLVIVAAGLFAQQASAQKTLTGSWKVTRTWTDGNPDPYQVGELWLFSSSGGGTLGGRNGTWRYDDNDQILTLITPGIFANTVERAPVQWTGTGSITVTFTYSFLTATVQRRLTLEKQ